MSEPKPSWWLEAKPEGFTQLARETVKDITFVFHQPRTFNLPPPKPKKDKPA